MFCVSKKESQLVLTVTSLADNHDQISSFRILYGLNLFKMDNDTRYKSNSLERFYHQKLNISLIIFKIIFFQY